MRSERVEIAVGDATLIGDRSPGGGGLSTGADVLIEVAGERNALAAVVARAAAGSFADWKRLRGTDLGTVPGWMMFSTIRVLSGDPPAPAARGPDRAHRVADPADLGRQGRRAGVQRALRRRGARTRGALEPARRTPDRRHPRAPRRMRAARGRLLRSSVALSRRRRCSAWPCVPGRLSSPVRGCT